jgi:four helix bundle protein
MEERRGFKKLVAWQKADQLASAVFHVTSVLPGQHRWLGLQMVRAAVSVPANIAEGYGRGSLGDYLRFLDIAKGSLSEVEYYIHFLLKEGLISEEEGKRLSLIRAESGLILHRLWLSLKTKAPSSWDHNGTGTIRELPLESYEVDA